VSSHTAFFGARKAEIVGGKIISVVNILHNVTDIPEMKLSDLHLFVLSNNRMTVNEREEQWKNIVVTRSKPLRLGKQKNSGTFWLELKEV
jgi:hypothetical protein